MAKENMIYDGPSEVKIVYMIRINTEGLSKPNRSHINICKIDLVNLYYLQTASFEVLYSMYVEHV
jgi:hypothetical protein